MTKPEAEARCVELNRRSSGDEHWFARKAGENEDWTAVQMSGMPSRQRGPLKADVETPPRPGAPPDPRPSLIRNIPPYGPS